MAIGIIKNRYCTQYILLGLNYFTWKEIESIEFSMERKEVFKFILGIANGIIQRMILMVKRGGFF